jgi:predicted nucleic acid-binding Zn ribbon protein
MMITKKNPKIQALVDEANQRMYEAQVRYMTIVQVAHNELQNELFEIERWLEKEMLAVQKEQKNVSKQTS